MKNKGLFLGLMLFGSINLFPGMNSDYLRQEQIKLLCEYTKEKKLDDEDIKFIESLIDDNKIKDSIIDHYDENTRKEIRKLSNYFNIPSEWIYKLFYKECRLNNNAVNYINSYISFDNGKNFISLATYAKKVGKNKVESLLETFKTKKGKEELKSKKIIIKLGATGLIQFMPSTARNLGTTVEKIQVMTVAQQLELVKIYLERINPSKEFKTFIDLYLAVFFPAAAGQVNDYILGSHISEEYVEKVAYQNRGIDSNNNNQITKEEFAIYANRC